MKERANAPPAGSSPINTDKTSRPNSFISFYFAFEQFASGYLDMKHFVVKVILPEYLTVH